MVVLFANEVWMENAFFHSLLSKQHPHNPFHLRTQPVGQRVVSDADLESVQRHGARLEDGVGPAGEQLLHPFLCWGRRDHEHRLVPLAVGDDFRLVEADPLGIRRELSGDGFDLRCAVLAERPADLGQELGAGVDEDGLGHRGWWG